MSRAVPPPAPKMSPLKLVAGPERSISVTPAMSPYARDAAASPAPSPMPQVVLRMLGTRYELRRRLGAGGMAEVYLGWDLLLERDVAVKLLRPALAADEHQVDRFRREALNLARVESDRVVPIYDMHIDRHEAYLVLRHVPGRTLEQIVAGCGSMAPMRALQIVGDLVDALHDLHARGLVHRDVKPSNIVVDWNDHAILLDLGVAYDRKLPALTPFDATAGTPAYMAPEQRRTGIVDNRSDLYQAGLVLLQTLTGTSAADFQAGRFDDASLRSVPVAVASVLLRAIAPEPERRYASAKEMRAAIEQAVNHAATAEIKMEDLTSALSSARTVLITGSQPLITTDLSIPAISKESLGPEPEEVVLLDREVDRPRAGVRVGDHVARTFSTRPRASLRVVLAGVGLALLAGAAIALRSGAGSSPDATPASHAVATPAPARAVTGGPAAATRPPVAAAPAIQLAPAATAARPITSAKSTAAITRPAGAIPKAAPIARGPAVMPPAKPAAPTTAPAPDRAVAAAPVTISADARRYRDQAISAEQNGAREAAIASFRQYLRLAPDAPDAATIKAHLAALERASD